MESHVGRYGWNSVDWTGPVLDDEVRELIDASYEAAISRPAQEPSHRLKWCQTAYRP